MSSDAPIQADPYLSSKEAGKLLGYTHDYISKLCRDGKMAGIQRGRVWFVTEEEARAFQARHDAELEEKKAQLSQKFSAIRQQHETNRSQDFAETLPGATAVAEEVSVSAPVQEPVVQPVVQSVDTPVRTYSNPISTLSLEDDDVDAEEVVADFSDKKESAPEQKQIQFVMPRHLAALAVLALVLAAPSLMRATTPQPTPQATYRTASQATARTTSQPVPTSAQATRTSTIVHNLDSGVATVIATQSELVSKTANTYGFLQYLSDGYWELAVSMGELWGGVYGFLQTISDSYLTFYEFQGETIYYSFGSIREMGATVIQGYELIGESVIVGTHNLLDSYKRFFMVDSYIENSLKKK